MRRLEQGSVLFERYRIIDLIGSGGSGQVYLAENLKVGNLVAVKTVSRKDQMQFLAEKNLLKELRHSAIPIIMDIEEDETATYLIEEYVEGVSLGTLKCQLSEAEVLDIMVQLCDVLHYLHTAFEDPIIYRDMKPDNIIRMGNGRIKLVDFGIAVKSSHVPEGEEAYYGTRGYAAPEQLSYGRVSIKTDLYALGVCIYYMLTGKNLSHQPYRLLPLREVNPEISQGFSEIISKCTESLPAKRWHSAQQLMEALTTLYRGSDGQRDYEVFKNMAASVLTVAGIKRGIGTTHTTLSLARCFAEAGSKVAIVEWQDRDDLIRIASMNPEAEEERRRFVFEGIHGYFYDGSGMYDRILTETYDVILVDAGTVEELQAKDCEDLLDQLYVVCGTKDWEIGYFEDMFFAGERRNRSYLFNFAAEGDMAVLQAQTSGFDCYELPYNPNAYEPSQAYKRLFNELTGSGETETVHKGRQLNEKGWLQKCAERLKKA